MFRPPSTIIRCGMPPAVYTIETVLKKRTIINTFQTSSSSRLNILSRPLISQRTGSPWYHTRLRDLMIFRLLSLRNMYICHLRLLQHCNGCARTSLLRHFACSVASSRNVFGNPLSLAPLTNRQLSVASWFLTSFRSSLF